MASLSRVHRGLTLLRKLQKISEVSGMRNVWLRLCSLLVVSWLAPASIITAQQVNGPGCAIPPVGSINLTEDPEPQQPIWCVSGLAPQTRTAHVDPFAGWLDNFDNSGQIGSFRDGELGYHVFDNIDGSSISAHFVANHYWIVDLAKQSSLQGAAISPMQTFHFENGKLILEVDVAAGTAAFHDANGGDIVWPEVAWSTAAAPGGVVDGLYLYGHFQGAWTGGCRLQASRSLTCAVQADHVLASVTNDQPPCFSVSPSRVMELSGHQQCGSVHVGMSVDFGAPANAWRVCQTDQVDPCLDRFRFEWSKTGLVIYVNGIRFGEDSGWPAESQLPDSVVSGAMPVWVYFGQWGDFSDPSVYRFHWQRVAVNPHDSNGNPLPPSASPTFGAAPPPPPPPTAPVISGVQATGIAATSATILWSTDKAADGKVEYGTTSAYGLASALNSTLVTSHSVSLAGLTSSTLYHYRVNSSDSSGNLAVSSDQTFTTTATPPPPPPVPGTLLVGDKSIESGQDSNAPGMAEAFRYTAAQTGAANNLSVYLDSNNAAQTVIVGLYAHNIQTNSPSTLLAQATISNPVAGAWNSVAISPVPLNANTIYWIAVLGPTGTGQVQFRDRATGGRNITSAQTNLTTLPTTWTPGTIYQNAPLSAFASQ